MKPPALADWVLRYLVRRDLLSDILGDLHEEYARFRRDEHGRLRAALWYWHQVLTAPLQYRAARGRPGHHGKPRRGTAIESLLHDLRLTFRQLLRNPGITVAAVLTLALGMGANTAIFSLANGVLLKPLPYDEPERLVGVWNTAPGANMDLLVQSPAIHYTYVDEARVFEVVGVWNPGSVAVTGMEAATQEPAIWVTEGVLPALRTEPAFGRRFRSEDDAPGSPPTIIIDWGFWQARFGGDPSVIGRTLRVDGVVREIIGVLPEGFRLRESSASIYLPYQFDRSELSVGNFSFLSLGRLRPGVSIDQATAELAPLIRAASEKFPGGIPLGELEEARMAPLLRPLKADVVGNVGSVLWVLMGSAGVLLLIACANVANLALVRAEGRDRETAVRAALGASRVRLAGQLVLESMMLGAVGGLAGLGFACAVLRTVTLLAPANLPRLNEVGLDPTVLCFTAGLSVLAGLLVGLLPMLRNRELCLVGALKEGGRGAGTGSDRHRARNTLVVVPVAMALVLLVGSGLMIRSFQALRNVDPGFGDPETVLTIRIDIPAAEVADLGEMARTHEQLARNISSIPGVASVGLTSSATMSYQGGANDGIQVEDVPIGENQTPPAQRFQWVSPGYFATMQTPLVAGRDFTWDDIRLSTSTVVVTENFAREYWGDPAAALGKRISVFGSGHWREIVGVVGNVRDDGVAEPPASMVFWPMIGNHPWRAADSGHPYAPRTMTYAIRSDRTGSPDFLTDVRETVRSLNSNLPVANVQTMANILARSTARTSFTLILLGIGASVALLLGAIGVYGVISYVVTRRTREIGVRIALGIQKKTVMGMVLRQGLVLVGLGVLLGLGIAAATTRLMEGLLFGVNPVDPVTYAAVAAALAGVALLASYLPARRAASVDPVEALRAD